MLTRKFSKFLRKKGKEKNQQSKRDIKKTNSNAANFTCFGCEKQGHIKMECPNLVHKEKDVERRKFNKTSKGKRAYIAWDENDSTTSSSSKEEEKKINLCLLAKEQSEVSSASSSISLNQENYSTLLQAFFETSDEVNRLALANNKLKGLNNWLKKRVHSLEEELETVKTDFEHLNMIFQYSNLEGESNKPAKCENCEVLQAKVKYLVKTSS